MKKVFAALLAALVAMSALGCSAQEAPSGTTDPVTPTTTAPQIFYEDPFAALGSYAELSEALYNANLGEFYTAYQTAMAATNQSQRWALMAIAEAKLLEAAVMLPLATTGGHYAISRVAPYTAPYVQWGSDSSRRHNLVVTDKPITNEHRQEMILKWESLRGTGEYESWAEKFLKSKGYKLKKTYTQLYYTPVKDWDILGTESSITAQAVANTYDGLVEYDGEGRIRPAIANEWSKTVNDDGTVTYTFKLRSQTNWVTHEGKTFAKVTADDFVAGLQHALDAAGGNEALILDLIVNARAYFDGKVTDFTQVGVKAVNATTLTYTLTEDAPYFLTILGHGIFAPLNRNFYVENGGAFGADYDTAVAADSYLYGTSHEHIAYCGAYIPDVNIETGDITFSANRYYRNFDSMNIKTVKWLFDDGSDPLRGYNDTVSGKIDETGLNSAATQQAQTDGILETLAYTTDLDVTSYVGYYNINRTAYDNVSDGAAASSKDAEARARTTAAMRNVHFRRALSMSLDRGSYNAQSVGEAQKLVSLRNTITPGNFVRLTQEVTVTVGTEEKTYPAGTPYGAIMQDQIDADGVNIRVWNVDETTGLGSSDGFDGWYNVENAVAELNIAISELQALGLEVSAQQPISIDLPYYTGSQVSTQQANACKTSVEAALGGVVQMNLIPCDTLEALYCAGFYFSSGSQKNYDVYDVSGWVATYGDPQTYLESLLPGGHNTKALGIY